MLIKVKILAVAIFQDKSVDMRKAAEACLVEIIRVFDLDAVRLKWCRQ